MVPEEYLKQYQWQNLTKFDCWIGARNLKTFNQRICLQCGDGFLDSLNREECDDGNIVSEDGCTNSCKLETQFNCTIKVQTWKTICWSICGDGFKTKLEFCDDGNLDDEEQCNQNCTEAANGWECTGGSITTPSTCTEVCGDGILTDGE